MSEDTKRTGKDRRRFPRTPVMIPALLDQHPVTLMDISLGGIGSGALELLIDGEFGLKRGQRGSLRLLHEDHFSDGIEVEIVRLSRESGRLGARYVDPTDEQIRLIQSVASTPGETSAESGLGAEAVVAAGERPSDGGDGLLRG